MQELILKLYNVQDSYFDFVLGMITYAKKKESRTVALNNYLDENPNAKTPEIIRFVSTQPDFYEDAAYTNAG